MSFMNVILRFKSTGRTHRIASPKAFAASFSFIAVLIASFPSFVFVDVGVCLDLLFCFLFVDDDDDDDDDDFDLLFRFFSSDPPRMNPSWKSSISVCLVILPSRHR